MSSYQVQVPYEDDSVQEVYIVYRRRWLMLLLYCIPSLMISVFQFTFAAIDKEMAHLYGLEDKTTLVVLLAVVYMAGILFLSPLSSYVMGRYGLGASVYIGAGLGIVSSVLRWYGASSHSMTSYWFVFSGQVVGAVSQTFMGLNGITLFSNNWFAKEERVTSSTIGVLMTVLGGGIAYGACPPIFDLGVTMPVFASNGLQFLLFLEGAVMIVPCVFVLLFFRGSPPTPPAPTSADDGTHELDLNVSEEKRALVTRSALSFGESLKLLVRTKDYMLLLVAYGLGYGSFTAFSTLTNELVTPEHYTSNQGGFFGLGTVLGGIVGAMLVGAIATIWNKQMKNMLLVLVGCTVLVLVLLFHFMHPGHFIVILIVVSLYGFSVISTGPIALELGVEYSFPISQSISAGALNMCGTFLGIVCTFVMKALRSSAKPHHMQHAVLFMIAVECLVFCCGMMMSSNFKRLNYEEEQERMTAGAAEDVITDNGFSNRSAISSSASSIPDC